jgi:acetyl esterase
MAALPDDARALMAEIGPKWAADMQKHRDMVLATYTPLLARMPKGGITVTREHVYGPHGRHRLDIFRPDGAVRAPVVVFVHGGAFLRGSKSVPDGIYDNVLYWFARQGCLGVNIEYRLAPEAPFPAGAEDLAAAIEWVKLNAAGHGGDPDGIFLVGHSAGATHISGYAFDPNIAAKPGPGIRGIVLISGRLRVDALPENPNARGVRAYFGDDESLYEKRSPVNYAHLCQHPVMIAIAEFDNPLLDVYGAEFFWRVAAKAGKAPRFLRMARHNHSSMAMHFNTGEEILGREILRFMAENSGYDTEHRER